jgi:small subunit ribosomal protein S7
MEKKEEKKEEVPEEESPAPVPDETPTEAESRQSPEGDKDEEAPPEEPKEEAPEEAPPSQEEEKVELEPVVEEPVEEKKEEEKPEKPPEEKPKEKKKTAAKKKKEEKPVEEKKPAAKKKPATKKKEEEEPPKEEKEEKPAAKKKGKAKKEPEEAEDKKAEAVEEEVKEDKKPKAPKKPKKEKKTEIVSPPLFGKYDLTEINVTDKGLERYINLNLITIPHVSGRHANKPFAKARVSIVERLINGMMRTERYTGKKSKTYKVVEYSFEIINKRTKQNPVQVLINALQNTAPREEVTRLRFGGISVPKAVDISPSRRLDLALRNVCVGAIKSSHKNKKSIQDCLATEIIAAAKNDMNSFAISKKEEIERVAKSAR